MNKKLIVGGLCVFLMILIAASICLEPVASPNWNSRIPLDIYDLYILEQTGIPENDDYATALRYHNIQLDPLQPAREKVNYQTGDERDFYVLNVGSNAYIRIKAVLYYITDHLYFWIQDGVKFDLADVQQLSETFENQIYPRNREFFGSENTPGIDNDEHLYILYTDAMGGAAGYFSSADTNPREIDPYSNEAEIFMLSSVYTRLNQEYTYGVLAHEFQHMIHRNLDKNETAWINEGFSELAALLNGYDAGNADRQYARNADIQLNFWPRDEIESSFPHYGASFLFMTYLYDRYGEEFSRALVADPLNDLDSIDNTLAMLHIVDATGNTLNADDVFQDWAITNLLQDDSIANGEYGYKSIQELPAFMMANTISCDSDSSFDSTVHQYGVDYIELNCDGAYQITFSGQAHTAIVPVDPHSGDFYFWSNKGDQSDMTLSRAFDFTEVDGPVSLSFSMWYDLEKDWDYVYVLASADDKNWQMLAPPHCTTENITGSNQGCGYNGSSDGWVKEEIDLTEYAGKKVTVRFEYLTDTALNGEGFLIDDMHVAAIDYAADFEKDNGGWQADGFVRISNILPQTYRVSFVRVKPDGETTIDKFTIDGIEPLTVQGSPADGEKAYLIVSGSTRYTIMPANYSLTLDVVQ